MKYVAHDIRKILFGNCDIESDIDILSEQLLDGVSCKIILK